MTPEIERYIESQGWIMECESPLEMRHEDGSFATYNAAKIVIAELTKEYQATLSVSLTDKLSRLKEVNEQIQQHIRIAESTDSREMVKGNLPRIYEFWKYTYHVVFGPLSQEAYNLLSELNADLDYYNPDTSYQEDVCAFARALNEMVEKLQTCE